MSGNSNFKLVYSTDPKDGKKCEKCKELIVNCTCPKQESIESRNFVVIFRIEKNGRGGKIVTVLDGLPKNEIFLKELTKELKSKCGVGGTYLMTGRDGIVEIQGDKRDSIKKILDGKKIKYKGM